MLKIYNLGIDKEIERRLKRDIKPVLNTTGNGLVGYTIEMTLALRYSEGNEEIIAKYYLDTNGKRHFSINTYNLPE